MFLTGLLIGVFALLVVIIRIMGKVADIKAAKVAKIYCKDNNLDFIEVKPFPNHYGLYFTFKDKQFYASFDFRMPDKITWKNGSPLEKINAKAKSKI